MISFVRILAIALGVQRVIAAYHNNDVGIGNGEDTFTDLINLREDIQDRLFIKPSKACSDQYEIKTKRIIRTEDSLSNDALFVDAVISDTYKDCLHACCGRDTECDTTVYIQGAGTGRETENCFLFRCWFDDEQRCLFSTHEGYSSSMIGGFEKPRFSKYIVIGNLGLGSGLIQDTDDAHDTVPLVKLVEGDDDIDIDSGEKHDISTSPKKTTTSPPITTKTHFSTPSNDVKIYKKTTNAPKKPDEQVCLSTQFKCPKSRECIMKRLICDNIEDCQDKSDEQDCEQESQDHIKNQDQQIPSSQPVDNMASPPSSQLKDGIQGNTKDSTLPPNPPPPTHHVESNQQTLQDQPKKKEKGPTKDSTVSRAKAGQVEVPTGALFPLVVGLILTLLLIMMVGCRLRYMNRRLRYGRMKTNAHDADYLINGMYL